MDLSVVIPVFNGGRFISENLQTLQTFLRENVPDHEIIVVDDGSDDDTASQVEALRNERLSLHRLPHNIGKYGAIKEGMKRANGRCRIFTDADLPYELRAIPYMMSLINDRRFHVVIGDRTLPDSNYREQLAWPRRPATRFFSMMVRLLVTGELYDTQCGLKGFRSDVAVAIFPLLRDDGFSGDVELLYVALKYNLEIKRIPVRLVRSAPSTVRLSRHVAPMLWRIAALPRDFRRHAYASKALSDIARQSY